MIRTIAWRVAITIPLLAVVSVLTFLIGKVNPGNPIKSALGQQLSAGQIRQIEAAYGLNLPLPEQYWHWLTGLFTQDGGISIVQSEGVFHILWPAFINTMILAAAAIVVSLVFGVAIGTIAGLNHRRFLDRFVMAFVQVGSNLSVYWFGLVLIWIFAIQWRFLPASGETNTGDGSLGDVLMHLVLPGFSAAITSMLILARFARAGVIESMTSDYVRMYRSQGLGRWQIVRRHVARNVAPIILNTTGLEIGSLLSGVVFVESVFDWPGLGSQLVSAIGGHDYPVVQGGVLLVTVTFVLVNLASDIVQDLLNPRLRR